MEWPASPVYRSHEIGQSLTIDFVPLPATAALDNSHPMDFSLNPQINICSGRNILLLDVAKPSGPTGLGVGGHMACGCPCRARGHSWTSALTPGIMWSSYQAEGTEAALLTYPPTRRASKCTLGLNELVHAEVFPQKTLH